MTHILSLSQFNYFKSFMSQQHVERATTSSDILLYNVVRGKPLMQGFTPITNPRKLNGNGGDGSISYRIASRILIQNIKYNQGIFKRCLGEESLASLPAILNVLNGG